MHECGHGLPRKNRSNTLSLALQLGLKPIFCPDIKFSLTLLFWIKQEICFQCLCLCCALMHVWTGAHNAHDVKRAACSAFLVQSLVLLPRVMPKNTFWVNKCLCARLRVHIYSCFWKYRLKYHHTNVVFCLLLQTICPMADPNLC